MAAGALAHFLSRQVPQALGVALLGRQALLFLALRARLLRNSLRSLLGASAVRPVTILLCSALVWALNRRGCDDIRAERQLRVHACLLVVGCDEDAEADAEGE